MKTNISAFIFRACISLPVFFMTHIYASYPAISSLQELFQFTKKLEESPHTSLIIFDIDETLVIPTDPAFQRPYIQKWQQEMRSILQDLNSDEKNVFLFFAQKEAQNQLIESITPKVIQDLQKNSIPTIALTGAFGGIFDGTDLSEKRYKELERLGIDFSHSFPIKKVEFTQLTRFLGACPSYYQGILFACGDARKNSQSHTKGSVLVHFLKTVSYFPKKIVFVDDKLEFLQQVEESIRAFDPTIEYMGIHFTGAGLYPSLELVESKWKALKEKAHNMYLLNQQK